MKKVIISLISLLLIVAVLGTCFFCAQSNLSIATDTKDAQRIFSFFDEPENTIDAVFLGSSTTYASWNSCVAWNEYGISSYSIANAAQPLLASKFMIDDARKTQPNAVYFINITHYLINYEAWLHKLLDSYPFSLNKLKMTDYLCDFAEISDEKRMDFYFPIMKYKDKLHDLTLSDFEVKIDKDVYKSSSYYGSFLKKSGKVNTIQQDYTSYTELDEKTYTAMQDLLAYLKEEEVNAVFFIVPQGTGIKNIQERAGKQNASVKMIEEAGFEVLDLRKNLAETGIEANQDLYNDQHLNIHGSIRVTDYICKYLIERYGFTDKKGTAGYEEWDKVADDYYSYIKPHIKERDLPYITVDIEA